MNQSRNRLSDDRWSVDSIVADGQWSNALEGTTLEIGRRFVRDVHGNRS